MAEADDMDVIEIARTSSTIGQTVSVASAGPMTSEASTSSKVSFGVKKKKEVINISLNLLKSEKGKYSDEEDQEEEPEAKKRRVTHFEDGVIQKDDEEKEKSEATLVIPMVVEKDWRVKKLLEKKKEGTLSAEDEAKLELLASTADVEIEEVKDEENGFLADASSIDADYSAVPVEAFGLAVLRGCGWKDGDGIGKSNKRVVPLKLPVRRPKGLGLGNKIEAYKENGVLKVKSSDNKEDLQLKRGSYIRILKGTHRDNYGQVESFDEDNASVIVKLALGKKNVRVSQYALVVISKKEYERDSKCINRTTYDEAKKKIDEANAKVVSKDDGIDRLKVPESEANVSHKSYKVSGSEHKSKREERMWIRPELKVRFIDKRYKGGKLYNEKVRVIDAADRENCTVEDSKGRTYYQICEDWLETVIPQEGSRIMIVGGRWQGNLAILEEKERKKERVIARLLHSEEVARISYDDVCEWVGSAEDEDY